MLENCSSDESSSPPPPVAVLANKIDAPVAMGEAEVVYGLGLFHLLEENGGGGRRRPVRIFMCSLLKRQVNKKRERSFFHDFLLSIAFLCRVSERLFGGSRSTCRTNVHQKVKKSTQYLRKDFDHLILQGAYLQVYSRKYMLYFYFSECFG